MRIIGDKYELLGLIGRGGTSEVYLARDLHVKKHWAVKRMRHEIGMDLAEREADFLAKLDHPALPRIVDQVHTNQGVCLVMDLIEGVPLEQLLKEEGIPDFLVLHRWMEELCQVLSYLHSRTPQILYLDLKPSNIICTGDGHLKLVDLGTASLFGGDGFGTPGFAAWEQTLGKADVRSDIYGLGATMYRMATGKMPVPSKCPSRIPGVPACFSRLILRCMKLDPGKRPGNISEVQRILSNIKVKRKKLNMVRILVLAGLIALEILGGSHFKKMELLQRYQELLSAASFADNAESTYLEAVALMPEREEAYEKMFALWEADGVFEEAEEQRFLKLWNEQHGKVEKQQYCQRLLLKVGELYWFYKNEDRIQVMSEALPWMDAAREPGDTKEGMLAEVYYRIALFYVTLPNQILEGREAGAYRQLWNDLGQLQTLHVDENELVYLELQGARLRVIMNFRQELLSDGVSRRELNQAEEEICAELEEYQPKSQRGKVLRDDLLKEGAWMIG